MNILNKMTFQKSDATLRTDRQFHEQVQPEHHRGTSPLQALYRHNVGLVTKFPLDYMHLVCLGVVRRLCMCWLKCPLATRLSGYLMNMLSENLISLVSFIPKEFNRKPRSLVEVNHWKATEWRQFLLYTGPFVLMHILSEPLYKNFLLLSVAIRILLSSQLCSEYSEYAHELLITFVDNVKVHYGKSMIVYNIHSLIHLTSDAQMYGSLDEISAFKYENHLKSLKALIRKPNYPLQQLANRIAEKHNFWKNVKSESVQKEFAVKAEHNRGPLLPNLLFNVKQYEQVILPNFSLNLKQNDNCILTEDKSVVLLRNIVKIDEQLYLVCVRFTVLEDLFDYPLPSFKKKYI